LVDTKRLDFRIIESVYIPHRLEQHVYNEDLEIQEGSTITVFILLLKDSIAENRVPSSFLAPAMTEYNDSSYLGYLTELQMEFYIKLLQMLVKPRYAFFNVLGGKMAMLATQVNPIDSSVSVDFLEVVQHNIIPPLRYPP
jgi:hypothetical protein